MFYANEVTVADLRPDLFVQRTLLTKPKELQEADLVTVDWEKCRRQYSGQITERMMCADDPNNKTDICSVSITKVGNLVNVLWFYLYLPWLLYIFFPPTVIFIIFDQISRNFFSEYGLHFSYTLTHTYISILKSNNLHWHFLKHNNCKNYNKIKIV